MKLSFKELQTPGLIRSVYVATADGEPDRMLKTSAITVLREGADEASVLEIIKTGDLERLIDEQQIIMVFPNPVGSGWNYKLEENLPNDAKFISALNESLNSGFYTDKFRAIHDVHYLLGFGSGASMVNTLAAVYPTPLLAAAVCTVGGEMADVALKRASNSPVPALIIGGDGKAIDYFIAANGAKPTQVKNLYACGHNPLQKVMVSDARCMTDELCAIMWKEFFKGIRRTNTSPCGDVDRRIIPEECGFIRHVGDTRLGDNGGISHDWLEHVPESVKREPSRKVPLLIFSHGMSDNPMIAADMIKMHEIGEREGFITVYPFSSDRYKWNINMSKSVYSDVDYYLALIDYLKKTYPIDETRIYLSGFSNGAGMAMTFALAHPELIAAICPVDSTFPYVNMKLFGGARPEPFLTEVLRPGEEPKRPVMPKEDPVVNMAPLNAALERQKEKACLMPVMYFYGTREMEYPIRPGNNQNLQYDFWKRFNGIPVKEAVEGLSPDAVGVAGDEVRELFPSAEHPEHRYTHHIFYTGDGKDYYNLLLMHGKAHEVHPAERELGWSFVSRFSRNPDGSLVDRGQGRRR